jgi:hypothetical protein
VAERTWKGVVAQAVELAGARRPTEADIERIELLRALEETAAAQAAKR